jgi:mono/diheme cytochrome c family protein
MDVPTDDALGGASTSARLFLDGSTEPFATFKPPARTRIDTTTLADGEHKLIVEAVDTAGNVGRREIPFVVRNGPGIAVLGIRPNETVEGTVELHIDAFSSGPNQNFNSAQAESQRPIPVAAWVLLAVFSMWAMYYGIANFFPPAAFATGVTSESNPFTKANAPAAAGANASTGVQPNGNAAGFDYATTGPQIYTANCAGCHGAQGAGVPGAFPALAGDPVVTAADAKAHITTVLRGLHGKVIGGKPYAGEMPAYRTQLSDAEVAAVIDHERTSWGNKAPVVTPDAVKALR